MLLFNFNRKQAAVKLIIQAIDFRFTAAFFMPDLPVQILMEEVPLVDKHHILFYFLPE